MKPKMPGVSSLVACGEGAENVKEETSVVLVLLW